MNDLKTILYIFAILATVGLALSALLIAWVLIKIRRINLPNGVDFFDALRATPLPVVVLLDLLDLSLDIFSTPVTWVILGKLGLEPLRPVAVIKDLVVIPGLELLPLMTIAWVVARVWKNAHVPTAFPRLSI